MKNITIILAILFLNACSWLPVNEVVIDTPVKLDCGSSPQPDPIDMLPVAPTVVTDIAGIYWIGITPKHYENLSTNMRSIASHISQQNAQVAFYTTCLDSQ